MTEPKSMYVTTLLALVKGGETNQTEQNTQSKQKITHANKTEKAHENGPRAEEGRAGGGAGRKKCSARTRLQSERSSYEFEEQAFFGDEGGP